MCDCPSEDDDKNRLVGCGADAAERPANCLTCRDADEERITRDAEDSNMVDLVSEQSSPAMWKETARCSYEAPFSRRACCACLHRFWRRDLPSSPRSLEGEAFRVLGEVE